MKIDRPFWGRGITAILAVLGLGSRLHAEQLERSSLIQLESHSTPDHIKIAILSDIHGNSIALDAVLRDISSQGGVDAYWVLGDLVALGPDPVGVLERLSKLPNGRFIRGNTDRYVAFCDRPAPTIQEAKTDPKLLPSLVEVANTFAWTQGMITAGGWFNWLRDLPLEVSVTLPDGTRFLGVHASPGQDDGPGIAPDTTEAELKTLFTGCTSNFVCVGHTHAPSERHWNGIHIVGLGSVSLSVTQDKASSYSLLDVTNKQYHLQHRKVAYDRLAVIDQLLAINHPARSFLIRHLSDTAAVK